MCQTLEPSKSEEAEVEIVTVREKEGNMVRIDGRLFASTELIAYLSAVTDE